MHQFTGALPIAPSRPWPRLATVLALTLGLLIWTGSADARLKGGLMLAGDNASASIAIDAFGDWLSPMAAQPTYPGGTLGGLFNRGGLIGGFAAGFLGSGMIGLLFGHGLFGELSGVASILGLTFQLALIVMLARAIWSWWRLDREISPRQLADAYGHTRHEALPDIAPSDDAGAANGDSLAKAGRQRP